MRTVRIKNPFLVVAVGLLVAQVTIAQAQEGTTKLSNGCVRRAPADTNRVVLRDSTAPSRWTTPIQAQVGRHEICSGMTRDMTVKSWGLPRQIYLVTDSRDTTMQFFYLGATVVLVNDHIRAIRPPSAPPSRPR